MYRAWRWVIPLLVLFLASDSAAGSPARVERHYRISGKVRLLFFWVGSDAIGSARVTWHNWGEDGRAFTLLIGSDPERAPRRINEWGYVREEVRGDAASVFGIRTITDASSPDEAATQLEKRKGYTPYGALCSTVTPQETISSVATLNVSRDVTYHQLDRALDALEGSDAWETRRMHRPGGAAPGFLTALDGRLRGGIPASRAGPVSFVYKDAVYQLSVRRTDSIAEYRAGAGVFRDVLRTEFGVRKRGSGGSTNFTVTYGERGTLTGVPIRVTYQPHWWLRIELELDDAFASPHVSSSDGSIVERVAHICEQSRVP